MFSEHIFQPFKVRDEELIEGYYFEIQLFSLSHALEAIYFNQGFLQKQYPVANQPFKFLAQEKTLYTRY